MAKIGKLVAQALLMLAVLLVVLAVFGIATWYQAGWVGTGMLSAALFAFILTRPEPSTRGSRLASF